MAGGSLGRLRRPTAQPVRGRRKFEIQFGNVCPAATHRAGAKEIQMIELLPAPMEPMAVARGNRGRNI